MRRWRGSNPKKLLGSTKRGIVFGGKGMIRMKMKMRMRMLMKWGKKRWKLQPINSKSKLIKIKKGSCKCKSLSP